jgi:hypothetical protein
VSTNLSIKNVPDELAERLRARAKRNRRSLQGELLAILEAAEGEETETRMTLRALRERGAAYGLRTESESARWIREDRDAR